MIDWMRCPAIERVAGRRGGLPVIRHSRVRPEDLIENLEQGPQWLAENHELPLDDVATVLSFYESQTRLHAAAS